MANQHDLVAAHSRKAAVDRRVIAKGAVAMNFAELPANEIHIIAEERALRMPCYLNRLPGTQVVVGLAKQGCVVHAKLAKLFRVVHLLLGLHRLQLENLLLQLGQRLLEVQRVAWHAFAIRWRLGAILCGLTHIGLRIAFGQISRGRRIRPSASTTGLPSLLFAKRG